MASHIRRRKFLATLGGAAGWPLSARAQQPERIFGPYGSSGNSQEITMPKNVDEMQQLGKDSMDIAMKSFGAMSEGFQAIAAEVANYSKKSLEDHKAAMEKLIRAKSPEKAIEVQSEYIKVAYEGAADVSWQMPLQ